MIPPKKKSKKILMLGSFAVGKTSLVTQYVFKREYDESYHTTIGVKVDKKIVEVDGREVMLMIWDMAGEETLTKKHESYLRGSSGHLLVADGTRSETLKHAQDIQEALEDLGHKVPFTLLINKADLKAEWEIEEHEIEALERDGWKVFKSSAITGECVEEAFLWLARLMVED